MSSNIKFFIAAGIAIAVLVGAIIFLSVGGDDTETSDSQSSSVSQSDVETIYLNTFETADITDVTMFNGNEKFAFTQHSRTKVDAEGNETEEFYYVIDEYDDILQEEGYLYTIPNNLACAQASLVTETPENLAEYGLDEQNAAYVTLKTASDEVTVYIGNETPVAGTTYVKLAGSDAVYTVENTAVLHCKQKLFHFISKTVLEEPEKSVFPKINKVTVSRQDIDYDIVFEYDKTADYKDIMHGNTASHIMTSPVNAYLDVTISSDYTHGIFGLLANDIYKIYPTTDELAECGFDDPYCSVFTEIEDGIISFLVGDEVEVDGITYRYGYLYGVDVIYLFNDDNAPWISMTPQTIASSMVLGTYVYDVGTLTVESEVGDLSFEGSGDSESYEVTLNGEEYDSEMFRTFYQFLLKTPGESIYIGEVDENELICKIQVGLQNDYDGVISDETIEFYSTDGRNAIIVHNGTPSFICSISYVDALLGNIERVLNGEEAILTF